MRTLLGFAVLTGAGFAVATGAVAGVAAGTAALAYTGKRVAQARERRATRKALAEAKRCTRMEGLGGRKARQAA